MRDYLLWFIAFMMVIAGLLIIAHNVSAVHGDSDDCMDWAVHFADLSTREMDDDIIDGQYALVAAELSQTFIELDNQSVDCSDIGTGTSDIEHRETPGLPPLAVGGVVALVALVIRYA